MKILNTDEITSNRLKILVVGESGAGKTRLASTLKEPTLVISAEAGLLSIKGSGMDVIDISQDDSGQVISEPKRIQRLQEVYKFLLTKQARDKYSWIFIDSLTEISDNLLSYLNEKYPDKKDTMKMFGDNAKIMKKIIKDYRDLPHYNCVMTCLITQSQNEDGQIVKQPMVTGKLKDNLTAFFDEVFYLYVQEDKETKKKTRRLLTGVHGNISFTKDRSGSLNITEDADLQLIANKIQATNQATQTKEN